MILMQAFCSTHSDFHMEMTGLDVLAILYNSIEYINKMLISLYMSWTEIVYIKW